MNTRIIQLFILSTAFFAASTLSAAPFTNPPAGTVAPNNNTAFPIHVGPNIAGVGQIKGAGAPPLSGGGLSVGAFIAKAAAAFENTVFIGNFMLGAPFYWDPNDLASLEPFESTLSVGDASSVVDFSVQGKAYVNDAGLYSEQIIAPNEELKTLCADNDGNIIFCPDDPAPPPVPANHVVSGKISYTCLNTRTWHAWPQAVDYHQGDGRLQISLDRVTTEPLTIQFAYCVDDKTTGGNNWNNTCYGRNLVSNFPSGYQVSNLAPYNNGITITIPQGTKNYTTPVPLTLNGATNYAFTCLEHNGKRRKRGKVSQLRYLYLKDASPGNKTLRFNGQSYQHNYTAPVPITIQEI